MASPIIRFKSNNISDVTSTWIPRELSSITYRVTRKNTDNQTNLPLTLSARYGLIAQDSYFKKTVASTDLSKYILLLKGEFAYNHSSSIGFEYGAIKRLEAHSCGAVTPVYFCFGINNNANIDSDFLAYYRNFQKKCARPICPIINHVFTSFSKYDTFQLYILSGLFKGFLWRMVSKSSARSS